MAVIAFLLSFIPSVMLLKLQFLAGTKSRLLVNCTVESSLGRHGNAACFAAA